MGDRGLGPLGAGREALGEVCRRQVVQFGAGARGGGGGQRGGCGRHSLLADGVGSAHDTRPEVRGHHGGHDLRGEVRLGVQGHGGAVLAAHPRGVVVVVRLRLYCWN